MTRRAGSEQARPSRGGSRGSEKLRKFYGNLDKGGGSWFTIDEPDLKKLGVKPYTINPDTHYLTILPYRHDDLYFLEIFVHFQVGPDKLNILCPKKMWKEGCPVCDVRQQLVDEGEPKEIFGEFGWTRRFMFYAVDAQSKKTIAEGPRLVVAPQTVMEGIATVSEEPRTGDTIDVSDPEEGVTLVFKRKGTSQFGTKYFGFSLEDQQEEIPESYYDLPPFEDLLVEPDMEEVNAALSIVSDVRYNEEEVEPEPRRAAGKRQRREEPAASRRRTHREEPVEEEPEEKPAASRRRTRREEPPEEETEEDPRREGDPRARRTRPPADQERRGRRGREEEEPEEERPAVRRAGARTAGRRAARGRDERVEEEEEYPPPTEPDDDLPF